MKKIIFILFATLALVSCDLMSNKGSDSFSDSFSGLVAPVNDISISAIETTQFVKRGEIITVDIIITNSGTSTIDEEFEMSLNNQSEGVIIGNETMASSLAPEDSIIVSYSWNTGNVNIGEQILVAKHTFKDDNATNDSLETTVTVSESDSTDLAVTEVRLPDMIEEGKVVDVEVVVKNIGSQDINESITITLNDLTDGKILGAQKIEGGLEKGNSTTFTYSWDTRGYSIGDHTLEASHDFADENTANNSRTVSIIINEDPVTDIAVTSIESPSKATQGDNLEVSVTVRNMGNRDTAGDFTVTLRDQTDDKQIANKTINGLDVQNTVVLTFVWDTRGYSIGNHVLEASHDFTDENTDNDSRTTSVTINEDPVTDIAVTSIEAPSAATHGDDLEVSVTVRNMENRDTAEDFTIILRDQTDDEQIASKTISGLDADRTAGLTFIWDTRGYSIGDHILEASHDFADKNATNDSRTTSVTINETAVTDIAIASIEAPLEATHGGNIEVKMEIENEGNQDVDEAITITLVDQNDGSTIDSKSINRGLDAGAAKSITFNWDTEGASPGNHRLVARHNLADDNSDNDSKSIEIRIIEEIFSDIAITEVDASDDDVEKGDKVKIEVTLSNQGDRDVSEDIIVTLEDQTENKTIGSEKLSGGLEIGSSKTLKFVWNIRGNVSEGDHTLIVSHDFGDDNLANNSRTFEIEVEDD